MAEIAHINAKRMAAGVSAHDIGWLSAGQLLDI
jgi:hypothetical protein